MFAILEGIGFAAPTLLQLSSDGDTLLNQITARFPHKASLPWPQLVHSTPFYLVFTSFLVVYKCRTHSGLQDLQSIGAPIDEWMHH